MGSSNRYLTDLLGTVEGAVPHDEVLRLLADAGLIGASLGIALAIAVVRTLWKTRLPQEDRYEFLRPLALGSFVSFLVCSLTDNTLEYYSVFTGYVAAFAGLQAVRAEQVARSGRSSTSPPTLNESQPSPSE